MVPAKNQYNAILPHGREDGEEMNDQNEVRLTGSVDRIKSVQTKTGAPMAEIILRVRQDRFRVLSHGNIAEHLLVTCGSGDRLTITGTLSTSSWKDESTGEWRNSFAVTAWAVEIHGQTIAFQRKQQPHNPNRKNGRRDELPMAQDGDYF